MKPRGSIRIRIHKGSLVIPILSRINPIPHNIKKIYILALQSNLRLSFPRDRFIVGLLIISNDLGIILLVNFKMIGRLSKQV